MTQAAGQMGQNTALSSPYGLPVLDSIFSCFGLNVEILTKPARSWDMGRHPSRSFVTRGPWIGPGPG